MSVRQARHNFIYRYILICGILLIAFFFRIQGISNVPEGQFTGNDPYLYYWQAQMISEQGHLPERDMHRWLPLGRDLGQTLNLYSYILAYTYKGVAWVFPKITLYQVTFYAPVVCFCIGLGALCLFLYHTYGTLFASLAGVLLATLPGAINRSNAGFGDRDSWCLMLGILAVTTYLISLETQHTRKKILWTLASGATVFLGGISWEGFGVFLSIILSVELWRFLSSETEEHLGLYLLWVVCFVPTLYLASPAYQSGYGFAEHLTAFVLVPPLVLLGMRALRHLLLSKLEKRRPHARTLALGLTLASLVIALGYVWIQRNTFVETTVPFSQNELMQSVAELDTFTFNAWIAQYGTTFFFCCIGMLIASIHFWKERGIVFAIPLVLFHLTTFFRQALDLLWGTSFGNALFEISISGCVIALLFIAWGQKESTRNDFFHIAFIAWFLVWAGLARDAIRYAFFIGIPLAFFTAELIQTLADDISTSVKRYSWQVPLKIGVALLILSLLLFWAPAGGLAKNFIHTDKHLREATPGRNKIATAIYWMKAELPHTAVVAAHWGYGSMLNVLAGVKTIIDQDHYIPHWIHLYEQHIYKAESEHEGLEFLKSHNVTHLMLLSGMESPNTFLYKGPSEAFLPVYPKNNFSQAAVKIWEIHYPPDIKTDLKYLKTGVPEIDAHLQPQ